MDAVRQNLGKILKTALGVGVFVALAFFFNALLASRTQQPPQTASQPQKPDSQSPPPISEPAAGKTGSAAGWKVYKNEFDGYEIKYPPGWFLYPATAPGNGTDLTDSDISEYRLVPSPDDPEHVRINIITFPARQKPDLKSWLQSYDQERVFSESLVTIAGISGVKRIETNSEFLQMKSIERAITIYLPWKDSVFRILIFPENSNYLDIVNTILQSFRPLE